MGVLEIVLAMLGITAFLIIIRKAQKPKIDLLTKCTCEEYSSTSNNKEINDNLDRKPLKDALEHYYKTSVDIKEMAMRIAMADVSKIKNYLEKELKSTCVLKGFTFDSLLDTESAFEASKVVTPDEFDVMIVYKPDIKEFWKYWDTIPVFSMIVHDPQHITNDVSKNYEFLNPDLVRSKFESFLKKTIDKLDDFRIKLSGQGPAITLNVYCNGHKKKYFAIDFVPAIDIKSTLYIAKPHPNCISPLYQQLWRKSFSVEEKKRVFGTHGLLFDCCHVKCLKIVKAICMSKTNETQLGQLSSYVFKTVLMHMMQDKKYKWNDSMLEKRFIDMLKKIRDYLYQGKLPHCFEPEHNLLEDYKNVPLENIADWIDKHLKQNKVQEMLRSDF